ncbi:amino acid adenylation domain-containing protein [Streptosporangium sp. G11]|uniref:amino acid adenylation domain-containing protein n=1 Tax=Streptosporangium sp. G11 TaxID=3436926 RepID=UPI003EBC338A
MSDLRAKLARLSPEQRAALEERLRRQPPPRRPSGIPRRAGDSGPPPLSFGQERLWFLQQLDPSDASYNMFMVQRLRGHVSIEALRYALGRLVERHETLRARFTSHEGSPVQEIEPPRPVEPDLIDLTWTPAAEREARATELVADLTNRPFDLAAGPLLRVHLITMSETDHVLCVVLHHIVADGWSLKILLGELAACYGAHLEGREADLPAPVLEYADYAAWQRGLLDEEGVRRQLDYWSGQLAGVPALDVPADRPRPPVKSSNGDYAARRIGRELTARLDRLARDERCTPFMVLLAAFQTLLGAHSGQDDVCVGSVIAGRERPELEQIVGFFPNTLALRGDLSGDPGFRELLGRVRATVLDAFAHQDIPFERLLNELRVERDLSTTPLFQAMFVMQDKEASELVMPGIETDVFDPGARQAKFDLMLDVTPRSESLYALLSYNADLFEPETVARMLRRYERVLEAVADDPDVPLSRLRAAMLLPEDRLPAVTASLSTALPGPSSTAGSTGPAGVVELFEERVRLAPEAVAVSHGDRRLGYAELRDRAVRLAARLTSAGVGPETVVAVCARRGPELVVALLATAMAGGAYLPLDPAYPAERLRWMLRDSGAALLLSQDGLPECDLPTIPLDGVADGPATGEDSYTGDDRGTGENQHIGDGSPSGVRVHGPGEHDVRTPAGDGRVTRPGGPGNLAYVIYTSGSTGTPKGVQVERRALDARVAWMRAEYGIRPDDRVLQFASVGFDTHAEEIYPALTSGAELVLAPDEPLPDFLRTSRGASLTVMDLPTSYWQELVAARVSWPPALRLLILGADPLPGPALAAWYEAHGERVTLVNSYGPTETTIIATAGELDPAEASRRPTVGHPLSATRVHVLDEYGARVPVGVPGELCVGGDGLSRGYLGAPALTAERFVPDPYGPAGSRLYRTGDRARFRPDGRLEILGRLDRQVKIRGYRVEPGEIEARLLAHPWVGQATVTVREDTPGDRRLVAYVVRHDRAPDGRAAGRTAGERVADEPASDERSINGTGLAEGARERSGHRLGAGELREYLAAELPPHLVPSAVVEVGRIPLTPSGKVDQGALPAPEHRSGEGYLPPETATQELVCSIWAEVLGVERVGALDDFFQLGGHSLLATRTIARLSAATGLDVPLKLAFSHPSVRRLAQALDALAEAGPGAGSKVGPGPARRPEGTAPPLSFAQERLWFMEQFSPGTGAYVLPAAARLRGPLDLAALEARLDAAVTRHESLRMRFPASPDGRPEVRIVPAAAPEARIAIRVVEAGPSAESVLPGTTSAGSVSTEAALPGSDSTTDSAMESVVESVVETATEAEAEARRIVSADAARPFDLGDGPLLRVTLVGIAPEDHVLLVAVHHIVADGWSAEILLDELLSGRYDRDGRDVRDGRPETRVGYGDYALWQRERLAGPRLERHLEFWREELAELPPLELPLDRPRPARQGHRGAWHDLRLDAGLTGALGALARERGATLYMALLSGFQAVLSRWSGQHDFAVGSPVAGRDQTEFEDVVGLFVNLLPLRARLEGDPAFTELLGRTRDAALEVYAHQELPFEKLVAELDLARDATRPPVVQVLFALQSYLGGAVPTGRSVPVAGGTATTGLATEEQTGSTTGFTTGKQSGATTTAGLTTEEQTGVTTTTGLAADRTEGPVVEPFAPDTTSTRFDLELYVSETGDGLAARFVYNRDLFLPDTVERLAVSFETFLRAAVAAPGTRVGDLEMLPPGERELVLTGWNATETAYPPKETLHGLVEAQAARTPGAPAVVFEGETLTYAELNDRADLLAARLRASVAGTGTTRGTETGRVFAVRAERSLDLPVRLLAVLKAGAAYLPLDPGLPERRVEAMLADAGAVELTAALDTPAVPGDAAPRVRDLPGSLAYVIFTSGSTGRPKGVGVPHRAIVNRLRWMQETYGLDASDAVLQKTPAGFDVSVWEFFWPLISGARLVLARPDGHRDTAYLRDLVTERAVTTVHFVPSMLAAFTSEERIEECRSLRRVICSGEELTAGAAERLAGRLPGVELHNLYGPTEAAVDVSWHRYTPGEKVVPIGRPVANTRLYVLDGALRPVPVGTPGELFIGGVQLALGYLGRPALTAERFVPDPHGPPGSRLYATGDRARWRFDGEIEYLGRLDTQIKIRGMRVEPGEIEAVLGGHPDLSAAAVGVWHDGAGARLVGYGVRREGTRGPVNTVDADPREWLRGELPEHMIPTAWVTLDALPLTPNGKLDRAALPPPPGRGDLPWEPPRTDAERAVAQVWQDVLGLDKVGRHDGFFGVGGDSIRSLSVVARLRHLGYGLDLQRLFTHQTVAELASVLDTPDTGSSVEAEPEPEAATGAFGMLGAADLAKLRKGER